METQNQDAAPGSAEVPNDPGKMFVGGLSWQTSPELATRMTTNLQNWKRIRASIRAQFTRWESYLKKHENLDYAETHVRLQNLHEDFQIIRQLQENIISEVPDEELDTEIETSYNIEEEFISIKVKLLDMQNRAQSQVKIENGSTRCDIITEESVNEGSLQTTNNNFEDSPAPYLESILTKPNIVQDLLHPNVQNEIPPGKGLITQNENNIYNTFLEVKNTTLDAWDKNDIEWNEKKEEITFKEGLKRENNKYAFLITFKCLTGMEPRYSREKEHKLNIHKHKWKDKEEGNRNKRFFFYNTYTFLDFNNMRYLQEDSRYSYYYMHRVREEEVATDYFTLPGPTILRGPHGFRNSH